MISLLAIDPVLKGDLLWTPLLIVVLKVLVVFVTGLVATMLMVWFERKVVAGMGNRIGPNKAGPFGLLQTLADGIKLFFKEDLVPGRADPFVFKIAPFLAFVPAFLSFSIIPLGGDFRGDNGTPRACSLQIRRSACCSRLLFLQSRSTESCWLAGPAARSTHCLVRFAHLRRWSVMKQHLGFRLLQ